MAIGEQIKALRIKAGLTQQELGEKCGMADSAIRRLESGRTNPTLTTIQRIASALDVTIDYLLDRTDKHKPSTSAPPDGPISDDDIKLALFKGADEVTDEMWKEAQFAVQLIMDRHKREKENAAPPEDKK